VMNPWATLVRAESGLAIANDGPWAENGRTQAIRTSGIQDRFFMAEMWAHGLPG